MVYIRRMLETKISSNWIELVGFKLFYKTKKGSRRSTGRQFQAAGEVWRRPGTDCHSPEHDEIYANSKVLIVG